MIVNLHAQLNMLGGLMLLLIGLALVALREPGAPGRRAGRGGRWSAFRRGWASTTRPGSRSRRSRRIASLAAASFGVRGRGARALAGARARARRARRARRLRRLRGAAWRDDRRASAPRAGRRSRRRPRRLHGHDPDRVRRRSPAALAGYELPLGLTGLPRASAGSSPASRSPASILLMAGPAITWAIIPVAFTPVRQGPLRGVGWGSSSSGCRRCALVSSAAPLPGARRAPREADRRAAPCRRAAREPAAYRTRVSVAIGAIALLLVALPFVPAVAGVGGSTVRYSYEPRLTREVTGQFVATQRGPGEALRLAASRRRRSRTTRFACTPSHARRLLVRAAAVDSPRAYQLFDLDRGGAGAARGPRSSPRQLVLAPSDRCGRAAIRSSPRTRACSAGATSPTCGSSPPPHLRRRSAPVRTRSPPAVLDALLPLCAALVALAFAALLLRSLRRRRSGREGALGPRVRAVRRARPRARRRHCERVGARRSSAPTTWPEAS